MLIYYPKNYTDSQELLLGSSPWVSLWYQSFFRTGMKILQLAQGRRRNLDNYREWVKCRHKQDVVEKSIRTSESSFNWIPVLWSTYIAASEVHIPLARHLSIEDAHGHVCNRLRIIIKLKNSFSHQQTAFDDLLGPEKGLTGRSRLSSFGATPSIL